MTEIKTEESQSHLSSQHSHLSSRPAHSPQPLCAIVDFQMGWTKEVFWKFGISVVGFFTFGACAAALEWGAWKVQAADIRPDETRVIPGLPEQMTLSYSDLKRKAGGPTKIFPAMLYQF